MTNQIVNDKEEQRIINVLNSIKNPQCKRIVIDGNNIIQKQNKIMMFCYDFEKIMTYIYDEETKIISQIPEIKTNKIFNSLITLPNGNIVSFGGNTIHANEPLSNCELINIKNNSVADIKNMKEKRSETAAILLRNGLILIVGGKNSFMKYLNSCELFNPLTKSFSLSKARMKVKRAGHSVSLLPDGRVLICGGWNIINTFQTTEIYTPSTDSFTEGPEMVEPRCHHSAIVLLNGNILICGGRSYEVGIFKPNRRTMIYNCITNSFIKGPDMLHERFMVSTTLLLDSKVLIMGGQPSNDAELYDSKTNTFVKYNIEHNQILSVIFSSSV